MQDYRAAKDVTINSLFCLGLYQGAPPLRGFRARVGTLIPSLKEPAYFSEAISITKRYFTSLFNSRSNASLIC